MLETIVGIVVHNILVDTIEVQLPIGCLHNGLGDELGIAELGFDMLAIVVAKI